MNPETAARVVAITERLDEIRDETNDLSRERRELLRAMAYDGDSAAEISRATGLHPSNISRILRPPRH